MKLNQNTISKIRSNKLLVRLLEDMFGKSTYTMQEWLRKSNPSLCRIDSIDLICEHLNTDMYSIIEKPKPDQITN